MTISLKERLSIWQAARAKRPGTKEELLEYIGIFFDFNVPDCKVCKDHSTPADFITDVFFETSGLIVAVATRDGYKTLLTAIADVLDLWFKGVGIVHAGAIEVQAQKGYGYVQGFIEKSYPDAVDGKLLMSKTVFKNGGKIFVIPLSLKQTAGPHEPKLRRDETDLASVQALKQSTGMLSEHGDAKPQIVDTSTRYFSYGNIQDMIDTANESGRKVHLWCYKEVTEKCPDERSGTDPVDVYVDREALDWIERDEYLTLNKYERDSYDKFTVFNGCLSCPLIASCCGELKRANGNIGIDTQILKYQDVSAETWIAQYESRRAIDEGVVFKREFKERYHKIPGIDVDLYRGDRRYEFYRCLDLGRLRPSVGWMLYDTHSDRTIQFAELEPFDLTLYELIEQVRAVDARYGLSPADFVCTWIDPAGKQRTDIDRISRMEIMRDTYDLRPRVPAVIAVWDGIQEIKRLLKVSGGLTRFQVTENCETTLKAFASYHKRKDGKTQAYLNVPEDPQEYEHSIDRIRYYVVGKYKTTQTEVRVR
jgi:hypothetical protein